MIRIELEVEAVPGDRPLIVRSRPDDDPSHPDVIEQPSPLLDLQPLNRESLRPQLPDRPGIGATDVPFVHCLDQAAIRSPYYFVTVRG
jgi:hypothetical protein